MNTNAPNVLLMGIMRPLSFRGRTLVAMIASLMAGTNILWLVWVLFRFGEEIRSSAEQGGAPQVDRTIFGMLLRIALALTINAISLWSRELISLCISILGLIWVGIEYLGWYRWSVLTLKNAGLNDFPLGTPHIFGFYGATKWSIVVLMLAIFLFIWEVAI